MSFQKTVKMSAVMAASAFLITGTAEARVENGTQVSGMTVVDTSGKLHNLADYAGKTVVLEWTNHGCPYVKKHYNTDYDGGNMQNLQKAAAADDVVWLSVISSAMGKQGYVSGARADELTTTRGAAPAAVLMDPAGEMGRYFSAKTTPHMYIIDPAQTLVYQGAIDSNRSARPATIAGATNYVTEALTALKSGVPIAISETAPYGCSVKY